MSRRRTWCQQKTPRSPMVPKVKRISSRGKFGGPHAHIPPSRQFGKPHLSFFQLLLKGMSDVSRRASHTSGCSATTGQTVCPLVCHNFRRWYTTLTKTNSSPLKMVVSKFGISFSRGPLFPGALAVSFREGIKFNNFQKKLKHYPPGNQKTYPRAGVGTLSPWFSFSPGGKCDRSLQGSFFLFQKKLVKYPSKV